MAKKRLTNADFVHLHNHTEYSAFDGVNKVSKFPAYAANMGFESLAITDHGNMGGAFKFMNECKKVGIKPIVGCLLQGQEIFTLDGVKPVEQIRTGDMVLTHKGRFRKVLRTMTRQHSGELYTVNLAHGVSRSLSLTEEHPILIRKHTGELDWLKPGDIEAGRRSKKQGISEWLSYVCLPKIRDYSVESAHLLHYLPGNFSDDGGHIRKSTGKNKFETLVEWESIPSVIKMDRDFAYLLGLFCAEGSTDDSGRVTFSFHCDEHEFIDFCRVWIKSNLGIEAKTNERRERNQTDLYFNNVPFCYFLRKTCGVGSENKKIPSFILQSHKEAQQGFVRGLLDGDGKKPTDTAPQEVLRVTSRNLAWGLRMLMLDNDCWSTVSKHEVEDRKPIYQVPYNPLRKYARSLNDEDYVYKPIKSIAKEHVEVQVFNFEVEEDNSYVSDFILHNCEFYLSKDRHVHFKNKKDKRGNVLEEGQTDGRKGNRHLVLIAKNWTGYQNLCRLSQASWTEGYAFQDPRIDFDLLEKHHEGLICSSACFDENQLVSTGQGLKRIVDLSMSDDIIDMHGNMSSPSALTSRQFSGRMYHFDLNGSFFSLDCTEDHKIFIDRNGNQIWERAEEIQDNDFLLSPVLEEIDHEENLWNNVDDFFFYARSLKGVMSKPVFMSAELCFLAGAYLAEGHVSSGGRIGWTLSIEEEEYAQEISDCCYAVFGIRPEQSKRRANSRIDLVICCAEIRRFFLTYFGSKADGKFISSIFLHANKECKEQLLRGAFLGDGSFKRVGNGDWNSSKFVYASISRSLLCGLWQIAISVGLRLTTIANDERVSKDGVRHRKSYYMYAYGSDAHAISLLMSNEADWNYPISKCDKSKKINFSNCGKYVKLPISNISCEVVQDKTVYCLTENQTNAFLAHGLVVHNCLSSVVNANLLHDRYDQARKAAGKFKELFGEDFFLEVMYHGIDAEAMIIPDVLKLSDELNCKCIASNDCHYCEKCQGVSQELLMAMSTSKCLTDPKHIHFPFNEFYLKSVDEMQMHFGSHPNLLTNTVEIAASVDSENIMENLTGKMRLPRYPIPEDFSNPYQYLEHLAYQGLKELGWENSPEHVERLKMELRDVQVVWENNRYDFATYFLVVRDYIIAAKERDIIVGCGRGSGFGSVLLRCLNISYGPDPLKYGLLWERFLGFDDKYFVTEQDFDFGDDDIDLQTLVASDEARDTEDDMGGVDRY